MSCYTDYISRDRSVPSRSALYAEDLPGIDSSIWELLAKEDQSDEDFWEMIYKKAWDNLISDLTGELQDKFYVDSKLVSRETSQFKEDLNLNTGLAGVTIEFSLPRYARLHIVSIDVFSDQEYASPEAEFQVYDTDANGDLLSEHTSTLSEGRNTVFIDHEYEVDKVFVAFDPELVALRETQNKRYTTPYTFYSCDECLFDCGGYEGKVIQVNGGGLNVKYNVVCSVEKYACENINLFRQPFFFRIGLEIIAELRFGNRLNKFMTMTLERQEELMGFYQENFTANLQRSVRSTKMTEDPYCFQCKSTVQAKASTP